VTCWSQIVEKLSVKDLLVVSCSSKAVWSASEKHPRLVAAGMRHALELASCCRTATPPALDFVARQRQQYSCFKCPSAEAGVTEAGAAVFAPSAAMAASDDAIARQAAVAMTGLAHTVQGLRPRFKPQSYLLPPWLPMQPGKARGFIRVLEPSSTALDPSLVLEAAQVQWLSLGCLSGEISSEPFHVSSKVLT